MDSIDPTQATSELSRILLSYEEQKEYFSFWAKDQLLSLFLSLMVVTPEALEENDNRKKLLDLIKKLPEHFDASLLRSFEKEELDVLMIGIVALSRLKLITLTNEEDRRMLVQSIGFLMQEINCRASNYRHVREYMPFFTLIHRYRVRMKKATLMNDINERIAHLRRHYGDEIPEEMAKVMRLFYERSAGSGMISPLF